MQIAGSEIAKFLPFNGRMDFLKPALQSFGEALAMHAETAFRTNRVMSGFQIVDQTWKIGSTR
jgi:hypothetical protein